ncbi:dienelactone hydrolase [Thioalkalivibrio sp. K90mix]|uniref:dienelactone hydrolase family protein n=1 Tax=Thioalkalivibrio sp. (strain K90mix) TaxID=396595 RepID=UPI0001959797|nr:dienelactone hydrolase family protein [Thioalkalivibrio sp. K90mix]ADC72840.1 dienelactone hydrolase [Thioalkalivibrio sp. K90mix]
MAFRLTAALLAFTLPGLALAGIQTEEVTYEHDGEEMTGYLAYPDSDGPHPGVLVVHEWWGHNEYARDRAEQLAREGYAAFALDMYGSGKKADHPSEAGEFAGQIRGNRDLLLGRFTAAHDWLKDHDATADQALAALGYCFGGTVVLEAARAGMDLALVSSFHGALVTDHPAGAGDVKAEILVFNGAADPMVPPEQVADFREEMDNAEATYTFVDFSGVVHSFTNPGADEIAEKFDMPVGYDERADRDSWKHLLSALERM